MNEKLAVIRIKIAHLLGFAVDAFHVLSGKMHFYYCCVVAAPSRARLSRPA